MSFLRSLACIFASTIAVAAGCSNDSEGDGGGDGADCPVGSEGCSCYGNMSCDGDLTCASEHCVDLGGSGGSGATGGSGVGGSTGATAGSAVGGSAGSATGGSAGASGGTGGTSGGGGTGGPGQSGSGGMAGASGSGGGACGDTSSDWQNCGACGRTCDNGGERCPAAVCCESGACTPFFGPCFEETDGFTTCNQACASIGETCVARGCDGATATNGATWYGWSISAGDRCETLGPINNQGTTCEGVFTWEPNEARKRCCCTDTH